MSWADPRRAKYIVHFKPGELKAASDSASCSRTAATVKRELGRARVDLVCGEVKSTMDSIFPGISLITPTYLPPPAATIEDISPSFNGEGMFFPLPRCCSILFPFISVTHRLPYSAPEPHSAGHHSRGVHWGWCILAKARLRRLLRGIQSAAPAARFRGRPIKYVMRRGSHPPAFSPISQRYPLE
jgi:hypothetical protein